MRYIRNVINEMRKVTWLNADETERDTNYVIITSLIFAAFLGTIGWVSGMFIKLLMS